MRWTMSAAILLAHHGRGQVLAASLDLLQRAERASGPTSLALVDVSDSATLVASCPSATAPVKVQRAGGYVGHLYTASYGACAAACCANEQCVAWNWDSNETAQQAPAECQATGKPLACCWLRGTVGKLLPGVGCYGAPECDSWSGLTGPRSSSCPKPTARQALFVSRSVRCALFFKTSRANPRVTLSLL